ncbi:unnamed protein product [Lactuca virosa]|uniref:Uncharacterized protein n=1 Tax=Lactuca virosa TaxID=75947 RepID=A0AAU9NSR7_9ASTR|nr:unnamed protein product [Lactuca virosa]
MQSCITDVTCMLSDILETRDSMLTITIRKHLHEKVRPVFFMLHRLESVSDQIFNQKQEGEGVSGVSRKEDPKAPVKLVAPVNLLSSKNLRARKNCSVKSPS